MKREVTLVLSLAVVSSFSACAPEYILGGPAAGGDGSSGALASAGLVGLGSTESSGASGVVGGATGSSVPGGGGGATGLRLPGSGGSTTGGVAGTGGTTGLRLPGSGGSATGGDAGAGAASGSSPVVCGTGVHTGGYANPCLGLGEGGAADGACQAYDLVGAYWNGTSTTAACIESVDDISATTGGGIERGILSDLNTWSTSAFTESIDGLSVAAIGSNTENQYKLYTLELSTGVTTSVPLVDTLNPVLAGELSPGELVAAGWDSGQSQEIVYLFDASSGTWITRASFKNLTWWTSQVVLDRANHCLYALGAAASDAATMLYSVCLTGDLQSDNYTVSYRAFDWGGYFGGMTGDGQIVTSNFDENGWYVATVDPTTLDITRKGGFGDISGMSYLVYDSTEDVAYTVGLDGSGSGASFLYGVNLASGVSTKTPTVHEYVLARQ